ncbi:MAG: ArnT family glycosyltransferase [Candidatus Binatia bacterium]
MHAVVLLLVVLVGIGGRALYVDRPLDDRSLALWHEADYTQIARNFYRDGLNILYPQIDWRGDTPGYAEMEFPLIPWLAALLYRLVGYREVLIRVLCSLFSILSLLVFVRLCRRALPPTGAVFAAAAFALNPLLIYLGSAMQPESAMLLLSLVAITLIWRWDETPTPALLLAAAAATGAAILLKSTAAFLGLVLAYVVLRKRGVRAFTGPRVHAAAALALLPPLAWYLWAARFWHIYGNSLGVSNESHFLSWAMLVPPRFLLGLLKWETLGVLTPAGWLLAFAAIRSRDSSVERALVWYGALWLFYFVTAGTSADRWSFYYHGASVPPVCLLMGAGVVAFGRGRAIPAAGGWFARRQQQLGSLLAAATMVALLGGTVVLIRRRDSNSYLRLMRSCALQFVQYVPRTAAIVANGGTMFDEYGRPVAHNEPMLFAWMDRKGFSYGAQELSTGTLDGIARRGGRYWIVRRDELKRDDLQRQVDALYERIASCHDTYYLYDLQPQRAGAAEPRMSVTAFTDRS